LRVRLARLLLLLDHPEQADKGRRGR
jgi:hypothetical protein